MTQKKTLRLAADPDGLHRGAELLRSGGTVAFPTETVYGLGANALDPRAVQAIFEAKQRPSWDPLIVHVVSPEQLQEITTGISPNGRLLMEAFWPGPLTLLLPKCQRVPDIVTAGRPLVGVRMPRHALAQRLIELAGIPVARRAQIPLAAPVRLAPSSSLKTWMDGSTPSSTPAKPRWGWSRRSSMFAGNHRFSTVLAW